MLVKLDIKTAKEHQIKSEYVAIALGVLLVIIIPIFISSDYIINLFILAAAMAIAALGLTIALGYTGQLSLAQAVFYGIGAYFVGLGTTKWNMNWWVAFAAFIGYFLGLPL